jgi:hypothetical protein
MDVTALARQMTAGVLLKELALRPGADLVVRVQSAPANGGRGVISLAGILLTVQLPAGLEAGQRLPVRVLGAEGKDVLMQIRAAAGPSAEAPAPGQVAHAAGALALAGDGTLLRVAHELQQPGFALPLPNGDALGLAVAPDEQGEEGGEAREPGGEASFVLHSAALGPIEAHLRLVDGAISVAVVVEPGARARFAAALPELAGALERALGAPPQIQIAARRAQATRPTPPRVDESFDAYA